MTRHPNTALSSDPKKRGERMSIERPSTKLQDKQVFEMWRNGIPRKEIAERLVLSYHQVTWAFRRRKSRALCKAGV
jgi:hypothetical protein